jgi:hypothetical protein
LDLLTVSFLRLGPPRSSVALDALGPKPVVRRPTVRTEVLYARLRWSTTLSEDG